MKQNLSTIPYLGVGIGFRNEIAMETKLHTETIDILEIISDNFFNKPEKRLEALKKFREKFPIIPHGIDLSIGSALPIEDAYLEKIKQLCDLVNAPYYSEHFALTRLPGVNIGHLSPLWFTKEVLELVVSKIEIIQEYLGIPLVLENITSGFEIPEADFDEPEFINEICRRTGCGLLLDLTNVYINSYNRKTDPYSFLGRFPIGHVVQVHLAGGVVRHCDMCNNDLFFDTHSEELNGVNDGVWPLLEWTVKRGNIKAIIIERDENFKEDFETMILKDLRRARHILNSARSEKSSSTNSFLSQIQKVP